jgi:hypothetical protein
LYASNWQTCVVPARAAATNSIVASSASPTAAPSPSKSPLLRADTRRDAKELPAIEQNLFYTWIGQASPPLRAIRAAFASAVVYAKSGYEATFWVSHNLNQTREAFAQVAATYDCDPNPVIHVKLAVLSELLGDLWPPTSIDRLQALLDLGGRENVVTVSDVVRAVVVYKFGGVYLDADNVARQVVTNPTIGVDDLRHYDCDHRYPGKGYQPTRGHFPPYPIACMCNGFFAMEKGNPILRTYVLQMPVRLEANLWAIIGPTLFYDTIYSYSNAPEMDAITAIDNFRGLCQGGDYFDCVNVHCGTSGAVDGELCVAGNSAFTESINTCKPR